MTCYMCGRKPQDNPSNPDWPSYSLDWHTAGRSVSTGEDIHICPQCYRDDLPIVMEYAAEQARRRNAPLEDTGD